MVYLAPIFFLLKLKVDLDQQQREYFLNQQIRTIQEELGGNPAESEVANFEKRAKKKSYFP